MNKKVTIISLGCDKNRVDTENIMYNLGRGGYTYTDDLATADVAIINTCAFIKTAEKEGIDVIFDVAKYKETGSLKKLVVTGCLPMRYKEQLPELLPEVDVFVGLGDYSSICEIIDGQDKLFVDGSDNRLQKRVLSTPPHYAYLKIAEGCDNKCTYCTIPSIRGRYRSATIESLIEEARFLDDSGVKELILVAQDVTNYGYDLYGERKLVDLIKQLLATCSFEKIRLLYCYPELITDELIELVANEPRIAKYMDVPLQHVSNEVLRRMGRKSNKASIERIFQKLKERNIAIRTTFIVGFPGETDAQFEELKEFVERYKPDRLGIFAYSKEDGTPASRMKEQVLKNTKAKRTNELGLIAKKLNMERNEALIGKVLDVRYEDIDYDKNLFVGRTDSDAPDIDCLVYFTASFVQVGETYKVKITGYKDYDLIGEVVNEFTE